MNQTNPGVTRDSLNKLLSHPNPDFVMAVVGRALVHLYNRQTISEQMQDATMEHNGRGFSGADAEIGSSHARWYIQHGYLTNKQLDVWIKKRATGFPRLCKYHKQLNEVAYQQAQKRLIA